MSYHSSSTADAKLNVLCKQVFVDAIESYKALATQILESYGVKDVQEIVDPVQREQCFKQLEEAKYGQRSMIAWNDTKHSGGTKELPSSEAEKEYKNDAHGIIKKHNVLDDENPAREHKPNYSTRGVILSHHTDTHHLHLSSIKHASKIKNAATEKGHTAHYVAHPHAKGGQVGVVVALKKPKTEVDPDINTKNHPEVIRQNKKTASVADEREARIQALEKKYQRPGREKREAQYDKALKNRIGDKAVDAEGSGKRTRYGKGVTESDASIKKN